MLAPVTKSSISQSAQRERLGTDVACDTYHMEKHVLVLAVAAVVLVAACSVISSGPTQGTAITQRGAGYALPLGKIHIQIIRKGNPGSNETGAHQQQITQTVNDLPEVDGTPTPSSTAAPKTIPLVEYRFSPIEVLYVPDPNQQFVLNYKASALSEDDINIQVNDNGLLQKVSATVEDKTGAVILKLLETGKNIAKFTAISTPAPDNAIYDVIFDPFDPSARAHVLRDLERLEGGPYSFELKSLGATSDFKGSSSESTRVSHRFSGVAFRPRLAYDLVLKRQNKTERIETVLLPNEAAILTFPITRSAFVKKVTDLTFKDGILTEVKINKPSEVLAVADIPLEISKALVSLPGEIVQLKIDTTKSKGALADQQLSALNSEEALRKRVREVQQTRKEDVQQATVKPSATP